MLDNTDFVSKKAKKWWLFVLLFVLFNWFNFPVEKIELKNSIKFDKKLEKNNVFLKWCDDFDAADGYIYFLETQYSMVFKVEQDTGKLVKTISSKGQGPYELQQAQRIRVKNDKIFILDGGFNGIKIFNTSGKGINEIKFDVVIGGRTIDVNDKDEIFLGRIDRKNSTLVSVYDLNGNHLRSLISVKGGKDIHILEKRLYYYIRLDKVGNIYLLFYLTRLLEKYDLNGKLLWRKPVENELLNKWPKDESVRGGKSRTIHTETRIFGIDVIPGNRVLIGHSGGGCIYSGNGDLEYVLSTKEDVWALHVFKVFNDRLMNVAAFGQQVYIYQFKEIEK